MQKNQKGFAAATVLLALIISCIVLLAWYVSKVKKPIPMPERTGDSIVLSGVNYKLPDGWSRMKCNEMELLSPGNDPAKNCNDRYNTVLVLQTIGPESDCFTSAQIKEWKKTKPLDGYTCKQVTINNVKTLRVTGDYGGGPTISYNFLDKHYTSLTYFANSKGKLPEARTMDVLAKSVRF